MLTCPVYHWTCGLDLFGNSVCINRVHLYLELLLSAPAGKENSVSLRLILNMIQTSSMLNYYFKKTGFINCKQMGKNHVFSVISKVSFLLKIEGADKGTYMYIVKC